MGRIRSVDDLAAAYVPELKGSEYGMVTRFGFYPNPGACSRCWARMVSTFLSIPTSKLVMVQTAVRPKPISPEDAETFHLWLTIVKQLGGN
jgi:hypothetical protein